jgi:hypothetical protein
MAAAPEHLRGQHVVEAGVRQAWPFLTFCARGGESESRLYIDTAFTIEPDGERCDDGDAFRAGSALIGLNTQTVDEVATTADGGLVLTFDSRHVLRIDGVAASFTTGEPWSIHAL